MGTQRRRGFTLLEVLLAIALLGSGIIALLVVRSNCIDNAADTIRLRSVRLLVAEHAGHHLAYQCDVAHTPPLDDWQEAFPEYAVQPQVDEVPLEELLPEEIKLLATPAARGEAGTPAPAPAEPETSTPLLLRRLTLLVAPPGADETPALTVRIVTYKLVPPGKPEAGAPKGRFPEYPAPLIGPGSEPAPAGTSGTGDPNGPPAGPDGGAPPGPSGGG